MDLQLHLLSINSFQKSNAISIHKFDHYHTYVKTQNIESKRVLKLWNLFIIKIFDVVQFGRSRTRRPI
jgi:hypothetical protein